MVRGRVSTIVSVCECRLFGTRLCVSAVPLYVRGALLAMVSVRWMCTPPSGVLSLAVGGRTVCLCAEAWGYAARSFWV